jgi:hypothetical protein
MSFMLYCIYFVLGSELHQYWPWYIVSVQVCIIHCAIWYCILTTCILNCDISPPQGDLSWSTACVLSFFLLQCTCTVLCVVWQPFDFGDMLLLYCPWVRVIVFNTTYNNIACTVRPWCCTVSGLSLLLSVKVYLTCPMYCCIAFVFCFGDMLHLYCHDYCIVSVLSWLLYCICIVMTIVLYLYCHEYCIVSVLSWLLYCICIVMNIVLYLYCHEYCIVSVLSWLLYCICIVMTIVLYLYCHEYCIVSVLSWLLYCICIVVGTFNNVCIIRVFVGAVILSLLALLLSCNWWCIISGLSLALYCIVSNLCLYVELNPE